MIWLVITAIASVSGFLAFVVLPFKMAMVVNGFTIAASLLLFARRYAQFSQLRKFAAEIGCDASNIAAGLRNKFQDHNATIASVVNALDKLGNGYETGDDIAIDGIVGDAMRSFRKKLGELKAHEQQQHWTSKGLAMLNDIKKNNDSLEEYAFQATSALVKYIRANQASFYLLNTEQEQLTLLATYAYGKRKHRDQELVVDTGNGLLGQCVHERDIIYMTQVPANYVHITSGLGEALPRCILIVPMLYRDQIYGVFELASFEILADHEVEFCRKFTEGIAAELSGLQIQKKTSQLLEQSRIQADQLKTQEEVMRQQMEEMATTQEEMARHERTLNDKIREIDEERARHQAILEACGDGVISFDEHGDIQFFNKSAEEILGYSTAQAKGKSIYKMFSFRIINGHDGVPKLIANTGNQISSRTEINATDRDGNQISLLLTAAQVKLKGKYLFTLFAQKISVDLF